MNPDKKTQYGTHLHCGLHSNVSMSENEFDGQVSYMLIYHTYQSRNGDSLHMAQNIRCKTAG